MSFNKLKGKMREENITQEKLAYVMKITPQTLNAKLNDRSEFTIKEAQIIIDVLGINDPKEYFF